LTCTANCGIYKVYSNMQHGQPEAKADNYNFVNVQHNAALYEEGSIRSMKAEPKATYKYAYSLWGSGVRKHTSHKKIF
jgi:hypothetical protein